jgi:hypothetical protein
MVLFLAYLPGCGTGAAESDTVSGLALGLDSWARREG